jgi:predicted transcriptional regulator of viral defense system
VERRQNYESAQPDSFQLAANITPDAIICYASALMVFGKSHSVLNTMYISSERRFKKLIYQGVEYKYVPLPKREVSVQVISHKGIPLHVTTIERTLVDCLRSLRYSGGFENLYRSYEGVGYMNWKKIEDCLKHFPSKLLKARVGFFVELFKKEWGIPEEFFIHLEKYVPRNPDYFLGREAKSERLIRRRKPKVKPRRFIRRWNLIVPYDVLLKGKYNEKNE